MKNGICLFLAVIFYSVVVNAQHDHMNMGKSDTAKPKTKMPMIMSINDSSMKQGHMMSSSFSKNLPMSRDGSGTSWMPDESPAYMHMIMKKKTMWMFHGNIFIRYTNQDFFNKGSRGGSGLEAPTWFMATMQKTVGQKGLLMTRAMISLDPLLVGSNGYSLLFQSGETYKGERLIDHQHPHDLFSELSVGYTYELHKNADIFLYIGYPGEPALGPVAFMHRASAMSNPDAPLGHHWQDATHITFGVATLGLRYKNFKVEGSAFTGREPGEFRYNFDKAGLNSFSYRLSLNPSSQWALQFSQAYIKSPERLEAGVNVTRTTASALFSKKISDKKQYDAAIIWGYNNKSDDHKEHSVLLEDHYRFGKTIVYSRYEYIQKSSEELDLLTAFGDVKFDIHAFTGGVNRLIFGAQYFEMLSGLQATINFSDKSLKPLYGNVPLAAEIYLQLRPKFYRH